MTINILDIASLAADASLPLIFYEVLRDISMYLARHRAPIHAWQVVEQVAGPIERNWFENELWGSPVSAMAYVDILERKRPAIRAAYETCFSDARLDALVLPTTPLPARPVGDDENVELNGARVPTMPTYIRNTDASSIAGLVSITVPAGLTDTGLPVGVSFDGLPYTDAKILAIAHAFQKEVPTIPFPVLSKVRG
ncbi:MAG: hypothetical protein COB49_07450 [Alphaproteobacteria bacterium]|nr:MAG: hypothetical protein COB49_07450 [Alphaproteobacteria bacterium]